jgi:hypothetical protein
VHADALQRVVTSDGGSRGKEMLTSALPPPARMAAAFLPLASPPGRVCVLMSLISRRCYLVASLQGASSVLHVPSTGGRGESVETG